MQLLQSLETGLRATAGARPISVKAVALTSDNKILLLKRPGEDRWDMPGGGVDGDETLTDALVREMLEETGLTVDNAYPVYTFMRAVRGKPEKLIQFVLCSLKSRASDLEITLSHEHESFQFFDYHEIRTLQLMPSYIEALRRARDVDSKAS